MKKFTDAKTWYPGLEYRPDLDQEAPLFFRDVDASSVVPSRDREIYSTRIVDGRGQADARTVRRVDLGGGHVLGTGNPAGRAAGRAGRSDPGTTEDLSLGVKVRVLLPRDRNTKAMVRIRPGR